MRLMPPAYVKPYVRAHQHARRMPEPIDLGLGHATRFAQRGDRSDCSALRYSKCAKKARCVSIVKFWTASARRRAALND